MNFSGRLLLYTLYYSKKQSCFALECVQFRYTPIVYDRAEVKVKVMSVFVSELRDLWFRVECQSF